MIIHMLPDIREITVTRNGLIVGRIHRGPSGPILTGSIATLPRDITMIKYFNGRIETIVSDGKTKTSIVNRQS